MLNIIVKPAWILLENILQDEGGHDAWGIYAALLSLCYLSAMIVDLGSNQYATKILAVHPSRRPSYMSNLLGFKVVALALYPFIMMGVGALMGYRGQALYFLALICLIQGGILILHLFRGNFQASQKFRVDSFASVLERILLIIVVGFMLFVVRDPVRDWLRDHLGYTIFHDDKIFTLKRFIFARLIVTGFSIMVLYFVTIRIYGWIKLKLHLPTIKKIMKHSLPFALIATLYSIHDKVDQVMLERIAGEHETGLYAGAYRWLEAFSMYLWTIMPIMFARFAYFVKNFREQQTLLEFGQIIGAIPIIYVCGFSFFYGEKLLWLFQNSSAEEVAKMAICLKIIFGSLLVNGFFIIYSTLLTSTNHERFVNRMVFVGIIINVVLNIFLIPSYGAIGCACSTVISYSVLGVSYMVYTHKYIPVQVPYKIIFKLVLLAIACFLGFYLLSLTSLQWYVNAIIVGLGILALGYMMRLIPKWGGWRAE